MHAVESSHRKLGNAHRGEFGRVSVPEPGERSIMYVDESSIESHGSTYDGELGRDLIESLVMRAAESSVEYQSKAS